MIGIVARKEMTEMFRDGRFRWSAGITMALLVGALALGWQHYSEVNAQHEAARAATRQNWLHQPTKSPHSAAHYGVYAFKPKMPLSLVDQGVDPYVGVSAWLEAHKQNEFKFKPAQDATALQRLGELTGATVLQLLIPLVIILLTFSAFATEREQGTLRQLLSLGVRRSDLAWGKAVGIAGALGALLIPAVAIGIIALALASDNGSFAASGPRMAMMALSYLLYFGAFIGVSLAVSAWASSSRLALVSLLGFWIFNGLIAPKAVTDISRAVYPTPSALEFAKSIEQDIERGMDGHNPADKRVEDLKARLLKQYNVDSIDKLPVNFAGVRLQEGEEFGNKVFDKRYQALWETFEKQERIHRLASVFAPVLAVRSVSMGLAGTDFPAHANFSRAAEDYRRLINREMNLDIAKNAKADVYTRGKDLWEKIPEFRYDAPDLSWVLSRQTLSFAMLALWTLIALAAASLAAKRVRVN